MKLQEKLDKKLKENDVEIEIENVIELNQDEFAEVRHKGFGASDAASILNISPFKNASQLLHEKKTKFHDETISQKATVRMGRELEDFVINKIHNLTGLNVLKPAHMYSKMRYGLMTNFDGVVEDNHGQLVPMEIKLISFWGSKHYNFTDAINVDENPDQILSGTIHNDLEQETIPMTFEEDKDPIQRHVLWQAGLVGIPPYYYTQLQQQIDFLNAPVGYLVAQDVKTWTLYAFKVRRDPITISALKAKALNLFKELKEYNENQDEEDII